MKTVFHKGTPYEILEDAVLDESIYGPEQTQQEFDEAVADNFRFDGGHLYGGGIPNEVQDRKMVEDALAEFMAPRKAAEEIAASRRSLADQYNSLSAEVRVAFAPVEAAVNRRLDVKDYEVAVLLIEATEVPPDLEDAKQGFLTALTTLRDGKHASRPQGNWHGQVDV